MKINTDLKTIDEVLRRGVEEILPSREKLKSLMRKRKIRVYLGIDPTGKRLHLGHTIGLKKLQEFAELGHEAILVVGTGTVFAGDPSLRDSPRPLITSKEVRENIKNWKNQLKRVIDFSKVKIRYNGEWLLKLKLKDIIKIASHISAAKLFQREMFQRRLKRGDTVWTHEILYPLLQGYDSVALNVDLEIGGTDQTFNMLVGRELLKKMKNKEKFILTFPLILGIDGQPMSKTRGNCVWIEDSPEEMFGKLMSIPDSLIGDYLLFTNLSLKEIQKIKRDLLKSKPRQAKEELAKEVVAFYYGEGKARKAVEEFKRVFKEKKLPQKIPEIEIKEKKINILDLLIKAKLLPSKSEAKRMILQGGVKINRKRISDWKTQIEIKKGTVIQVGKRKFVKIK